jgi:protein phosphatase PTC7
MSSLDWAAFYIPHPEKAQTGGEDAYFYTDDRGFSSAAVFDGVGGWAEEGVDPKIWAQTLALNAMMSVYDDDDLLTVLNEAYDATLTTGKQGSSTAVMVRHDDGSETLQYINLGDSGVAIYRNGRLFFETNPQSIGFNYPYQLSSDGAETPDEADRGSVPIKPGDIIVLASDGLWDNLYHVEIAKLIESCTDSQEMAEKLCVAAYQASNDNNRWAPFGQKAVEDLYSERDTDDLDWSSDTPPLTKWMGGKQDDIAIIVGTVY